MRLGHLPRASAGRHRTGPPTPGERGAALVEFALIAAVLLTLLIGTLDVGYQWRYAHEATNASRVGARSGARLGDQRYADLQILTNIRTTLESANVRGELDRVIIYKANTEGLPPGSCEAETSPSGECNVYPRAVVGFALTEAQFNTSGCMSAGATHSGWCPTTRDTSQVGGDTIGVMVVIETESITGLFPTRMAKRHTAMRIEPRPQD